MAKKQESPGAFIKKLILMFSSLGAGIACAVGHHLFYEQLNKTTPPNTSYIVWGFPRGISKQQFNISVGNTLAFLTKAFLAIAVASAHDQISWRTIKSSPTELGLIDALFSSRDDVPSALNIRMWWQMPAPTLLLLMFWLLPLAPLIAPSTLTTQSIMLNTTTSMRTPQVDFTSMNFASIFWSFSDYTRALNDKEWQQFQMSYQQPQFSVQKTVQGSLISGEILPITAPGPNSTWSLDFNGPALSCTALDNERGLGNNIITQLASYLDDVRYLSWVPSNETGLPVNIASTRSPTVGGSPLAIYVMIVPSLDSSQYNATDINYVDDITNFYRGNTSLLQCMLQNVSYSAGFSYINGAQNIMLSTSSPLNNVSYLTGFSTFAEISATASGRFPYNPNYTTIALNETSVQKFAYQAVMDAFASMFVGSIKTVPSKVDEQTSVQHTVDTSMGTTVLAQAKEMANLTQSLASQFEFLGNVQWIGKSIDQNETGIHPMAELMEEMFRNATVSLMSNAALNPNYTSPFAPPNATVQTWTSQNSYQYAATTLWITYGVAIGVSAVSVLVGTIVVLTERAAYSTCFSTMLRVAHNVHLPIRITLRDAGGRDPLPEYLSSMVVRFPPDGMAVVKANGKECDRTD